MSQLRKDPDFQIPVPDARKDEQTTYQNPLVLDFADPCVTYCPDTGYYYACRTRFMPEGISVCRGRTLTHLCEESRTVFLTGDKTGLFKGVWASEMHQINNKWYIYAAATCSPTQEWAERKMRTFVLESRSADPFDGFDYKGILTDDAAIDATIFQDSDNQKLYLCYSRCIDVDRQSLILCEMISPTRLKGPAVRIARAEYPWELVPPYDGIQRINEGAFFLKHAGRTFCIYSANGCWVDEYCLGILELTGTDPMRPDAWEKDDKPLFSMGNGIYATGHASFFTSPDGMETFIAYHAVLSHNPNDQPMPRHLCVQRVYFDRTGFPHIGAPVPAGRRLPLPGGDKGTESEAKQS